ncbi:o-succinylbenzoate synthase [Nakamurella lactea]|uniref:o-succinylbenzoate synthase n=1 Tax=Nakamurella lactea TaxID=459515 RepID=UPI0004046ED4|nr:o-succinylbenzoate synthase [Nakamurella lactea]
MRIDRIEAFRVGLPLVHEFQTSSHRKSRLEHILVRVTDSDGGTGWGEIASPSDPYYCPETVDTSWLMLNGYLAPAVLGRDWQHPDELGALFGKVRGNHFAKAGVDIAGWDLWCRREGVSVASALGAVREQIDAGVSLGIEPTLDDLLGQVELHVAQGYRRVKLKVAPGWDVEPVRAVRAAHPALALQVDANGVYREIAEHLDTLLALDEFDLTMIEQPFAPGALAAHGRLQERLSTPICLDESIEDLDQLDSAIAAGAGRILNIKVSRMGGLSPARAAHQVAADNGIAVWCGGMHEFGVGRAANVAIAGLPGFALPSDVSGSDKYYAKDITTEPIVAVDGRVAVRYQRPGLGYDVDAERVQSLATDRLDLRS